MSYMNGRSSPFAPPADPHTAILVNHEGRIAKLEAKSDSKPRLHIQVEWTSVIIAAGILAAAAAGKIAWADALPSIVSKLAGH